MATEFMNWLETFNFTLKDHAWCIKYLSASDTLANASRQVGSYLPKNVLLKIFTELDRPKKLNPDLHLNLVVDSHHEQVRARAVWYNRRLFGGTTDETRLTQIGGKHSALLDPASTGALCIFAFVPAKADGKKECRVWICQSSSEADLILERFGPLEPRQFLFLGESGPLLASEARPFAAEPCRLKPDQIPKEWLLQFPPGEELLRKAVELRPGEGLDPDARLLHRHHCEYEIFESLEDALGLPVVQAGFATMSDFREFSLKIHQRRKSRAGRSLELHTRQILLEENLCQGKDFVHGGESEPGHRPDFIFPSKACYDNPDFPSDRLRMLAVKTSCRDRWRQVQSEAKRIRIKHLLTLQPGISVGQFKEMRESGVRLVVPPDLWREYPEEIRPELITLTHFIRDIRTLGS